MRSNPSAIAGEMPVRHARRGSRRRPPHTTRRPRRPPHASGRRHPLLPLTVARSYLSSVNIYRCLTGIRRATIMIDNDHYASNHTDQPGRARPPPRHGWAAGRRHADHPEARRRLYQRQHPTGLRRRAAALGRLAGDRPAHRRPAGRLPRHDLRGGPRGRADATAAGRSRCRKPRCGWPRPRWRTATPRCPHSAANSGSPP